MTQGRRAFGIKKKTKKDIIHFVKKRHRKSKPQEETFIAETGHPSSKKNLEEKLKKPRNYSK